MQLWTETPGFCEEIPEITYFPPMGDTPSDAAVVIFPGGGYCGRAADYEGDAYAAMLNRAGVHAFVVAYRVFPHRFPLPLLDARRAVRWVRAHAAQYGIDKQKVAVMGSSAGGHLAALVSTYTAPLEGEGADEIDNEAFLPNGQILCYPVICAPDSGVAHVGSYLNLIGDDPAAQNAVDPARLAGAHTPPAFVWHTAGDDGVNVINSYRYAEALRFANVSAELHVFPDGFHGMGLSEAYPHVAQWTTLLVRWLEYLGWINS